MFTGQGLGTVQAGYYRSNLTREEAEAPQVKERGNVGLQVQRGEELLRYLEQEVMALREAIKPVLKPEPVAAGCANESAPPSSIAIAEQLRRHNDGLEAVIAVVRGTRERVDL